ncbi:hypothetical protein C2845_PM03G29550 [Panicum miliaceum]|uniref:Uncharacterized protein n=1 Tax=Panicum miliaceum TaxID=4540 RepID=A0A3L6T7J7_PANMI|nr:hypothetical protein C2845_PM03G29550 [Panicum miliaceum]
MSFPTTSQTHSVNPRSQSVAGTPPPQSRSKPPPPPVPIPAATVQPRLCAQTPFVPAEISSPLGRLRLPRAEVVRPSRRTNCARRPTPRARARTTATTPTPKRAEDAEDIGISSLIL